MKLPIQHKYFQQIKTGKKRVEIRDAHLTLIDEKTNEKIKVDIIDAYFKKKSTLPLFGFTKEEMVNLFEDDRQICFVIEKLGDKNGTSNKQPRLRSG